MKYPLALLPESFHCLTHHGMKGHVCVHVCVVVRVCVCVYMCAYVYGVQLELKHVIAHPRAIQYFREDLRKQYSEEVWAH